MENRLANLRRIDFTWGRSTKKLNVKRVEGPPLKDSTNHLINDSPNHLINDSPSLLTFNIPIELTLHIISFLNAVDVLALGSCSKLLNQLCNNDSVWKNLYLKRWSHHLEDSHISCLKAEEGWKNTYISKQKVMDTTVSYLFLWSGLVEDIPVRRYRDALTILTNSKFGFEDVCLLFRRKLIVHLNLIGLHYAFTVLGVSRKDLIDALSRYRVANRQVIVYWTLIDKFSYPSSYTPDHYALTVSLNEIANGEEAIFEFLVPKHDRACKLKGIRISCPCFSWSF